MEKHIDDKRVAAYLQDLNARKTFKNPLRQGREGVVPQKPLSVEGTQATEQRRHVS